MDARYYCFRHCLGSRDLELSAVSWVLAHSCWRHQYNYNLTPEKCILEWESAVFCWTFPAIVYWSLQGVRIYPHLPPGYLPKPFIPRKREIDDVTRGRHVATSHGGNTATVARLFIPDWVHFVLYYFITCTVVVGRSECFLSSRGPLPSPSLPPLLNTKIQILNLLRELSKQNLLLFKIFVEKIAWRGPDWWDDQILTIWDSQT